MEEIMMKKQPESIKSSYKGSEKLKGKTALITGADSGIGKAVAIHFAREGADVAVAYFKEDEDAEDTKRLVEKEGAKCIIIKGDITESSFCDNLVEEVIKTFGKIDILVNNAGTQQTQESITDISLEQIELTFHTNIISMIYLTKKVVPHLKDGSRIINTTSITSYQGHPLLVDYASTKGAITSFTRSLSAQLADKNILVNGVAPGPIWTPLIPATMPKKKVDNFGKNTYLGRPGQPSEVAPAYVYLASEDSSYVTGQVIHVNGGRVTGG